MPVRLPAGISVRRLAQVDTVEVCFLNGQEFPFIDTKEGWTVDGTEFKCRIEFGVKSIDYRSLYFNFGGIKGSSVAWNPFTSNR